jgi:hypothetical protein
MEKIFPILHPDSGNDKFSALVITHILVLAIPANFQPLISQICANFSAQSANIRVIRGKKRLVGNPRYAR